MTFRWNLRKLKVNEGYTNGSNRRAAEALRGGSANQHPAGNSGGTTQGGITYLSGTMFPGTYLAVAVAGAGGARTFGTNQSPGMTVPQSNVGGLGQYVSGNVSGLSQQNQQNANNLYPIPNLTWPQPTLAYSAPLPRTEMQVGEIIGYRCWLYAPHERALASVAGGGSWPKDGPIQDRSPVNSYTEIDDHNGSGIWAFKNPYDLVRIYNDEYNSNGIFGTIWMWGTVIEHGRGYRSQFAAVRSLDYAAADLIRTYGATEPDGFMKDLRKAYIHKPERPKDA